SQETVPGDCCQQCRGCTHSGVWYENGARWRSAESPCDVCSCLEGQVHCEREKCNTACEYPVTPPPNSCCPVCHDCGVNGHNFPNGAVVPSGDRCQECTCENGNVVCSAISCPAVFCRNPQRGECCPTCKDCEYEQRVYADGKVFAPAGSGPCLQCRCKAGNVICHEEKCHQVQCTNPIKDPRRCSCVLEGVEYEEGSSWHPDGPCSTCTCVNGEVLCARTQCPPTRCQHPTKPTGSCCEVCESCTYNHRIYNNGQRFTTPDQPCHICMCLLGTVECERQVCPSTNCSNPYTPPGECCPQCPHCAFENRVFVDGEAFPNPVSVCEECRCQSGRIDCHQAQCPHPRCNAPLPGTCCQNNCNGCSYAGKEYPNGNEFPHPTDPCRTCSCINGNIQCLKRRCQPLTCSNQNVIPGDCCPQCPDPPADCEFEQRFYRHMERFFHPNDNCRSCVCNNGTVQCHRKPCPSAPCTHSIPQECCQTCEGCFHDGQERANGETWEDFSDPCSLCVCRDGSVQCERRRCPPLSCKNPVQRQCCMSCEGCTFQGNEYLDGTEFSDDKDPCNVCYCYGGDVICSKLLCNSDCSHPYKPPGQCCGECQLDSPFRIQETPALNAVVRYPHTIDFMLHAFISTCMFVLQSGSVRCARRPCLTPQCSHPVFNACGCPVCDECNRCNFDGRDCFNGERFQHPDNRCELCFCLV
uniref:VWFC domain-containing protein n=1 Tax=Oryzias sinensis TaxID=183150 RepID=A0A8C7YAG1_9TELE